MTLSAPQLASARVHPETPDDATGVEAVVLAAFGPGRFAKTAERLRERARVVAGFVDHQNGRVVGSVRLWAIAIGETPALLLGPVAVSDVHRRGGRGAELIEACINHARQHGHTGILLVGDLAYFGRFGFQVAEGVDLGGPVDRRRLLWLPIRTAAVSGRVRPLG